MSIKILGQNRAIISGNRHAMTDIDIANDSPGFQLDTSITQSRHLLGKPDRDLLSLPILCTQGGGGVGSSTDGKDGEYTSAYWEKRILGTWDVEEMFHAMIEAAELGDKKAIDPIIERIRNEMRWWDYCPCGKSCEGTFFEIPLRFGEPFLNRTIQMIKETQRVDEYVVRDIIVQFQTAEYDCSKILPELIKPLQEKCDWNTASVLIDLFSKGGYSRAVPSIKKYLYDMRSMIVDYSSQDLERNDHFQPEEIDRALQKLGIRWQSVVFKNKNDISEYLESSDHRAAYALLQANRDIKHDVFEESSILAMLEDKQSWITINDPQVAKDALKIVARKAGSRRGQLDKLLSQVLGVRVKTITEDHYIYYADEILDAILQFVGTSQLRKDPDVAAVLEQIRYGEGVKLRYVRRDETDLKLGTKCGDCTSVGSIHFANSVMWLTNPAYQILKFSKGKRFLGKINFTLGSMNGEDAIIIDALEFNPQALKGKPYYEDARECFEEALSFLRNLARMQNRALFGLCISNSSGAVQMLREYDTSSVHMKAKGLSSAEAIRIYDAAEGFRAKVTLLLPVEDMERLLAHGGHSGSFSFFFQMLGGGEQADSSSTASRDLTDKTLPELERVVINPAQIADTDIAAAMRNRDFETASRLIMADPVRASDVKRIVGMPADINLSPLFLKSRLEKIFTSEALDMSDLQRTFLLERDKFVRL